MNYRVFLDVQSRTFLSNFEALPHLRPQVKDTIKIGYKPTLYKITREERNTLVVNGIENASDIVSFDYFVRKLNTSPDSRTMGRDIRKLTRTLRYLGR